MSEPYGKKVGHLHPKKTILLIVEGESEKTYFSRIARMSDRYNLVPRVSGDKNCIDMINNCIKIAGREGLEEDDMKVVVFDLDVVDGSDLEKAVSLARRENIILMTSNLSFEIWLLMHLEDISRVYSQDDYEEKLTELLGWKYKKSMGLRDKVSMGSVENAVHRGKHHLPDPDPILCNQTPNSTTLWKLLSQILDLKQRYVPLGPMAATRRSRASSCKGGTWLRLRRSPPRP